MTSPPARRWPRVVTAIAERKRLSDIVTLPAPSLPSRQQRVIVESIVRGRVPKRSKGTDCKSVIRGFESRLGLCGAGVFSGCAACVFGVCAARWPLSPESALDESTALWREEARPSGPVRTPGGVRFCGGCERLRHRQRMLVRDRKADYYYPTPRPSNASSTQKDHRRGRASLSGCCSWSRPLKRVPPTHECRSDKT